MSSYHYDMMFMGSFSSELEKQISKVRNFLCAINIQFLQWHCIALRSVKIFFFPESYSSAATILVTAS